MHAPPEDCLGHGLLSERMAQLPLLIRDQILGAEPPRCVVGSRVVATGIGSSEAHARYLVWLLNGFTNVSAEFVPLGSFVRPQTGGGRTLVVFSQGLSANARFALNQSGQFDQVVLFTAATEAGQLAVGQTDRAHLLARLRESGAAMVSFPGENEYAILLRVIGAACGFVAARRWVEPISGGRLPPLADFWPSENPMAKAVEAPLAALTSDMQAKPEAWAAGFVLLLPSPLAEFSQNLTGKFVEGLFWASPTLVESMSLAHGPFQQLAARRRPVWIIAGRAGTPEADLTKRAVAMLESIGIQPWITPFEFADDVAPIVLELLLNSVILELARSLQVNQRDWPGKGLDEPIYQLGTHPY